MAPQFVSLPYRPRGASARIFRCYDPEVLLDGPARTGKSRGVGERILDLATNFPGARIAVIRKTRASLSESFLQMWEDRVLGDGLDRTYLVDPLDDSARRANRHDGYEFQNGSLVWPGGLDSPTRLFSSEWDWIYVQEAIELELNEWELLTRGLTNKKIPHPLGPNPETGEARYLAQLVGDTNPDAPEHWLNQRCLRGQTTRLQARHTDNPTLTTQDLQRLQNLTGVRRARLYEGKWVAAEGAIWENWDAAVHVVPRARFDPRWIKYHVVGVDWGFTSAGCFLVAGVDGDGRIWVVRQVYQTQQGEDWWVSVAKRIQERYKPARWACDPSQPGKIEAMRRAGIPASEADNEIRVGLDGVRDRLQKRPDGTRGIYVLDDSLAQADVSLREASRPTCVQEEIPSYVYAKSPDGRWIKEEPAPKQDDHGCDGLRYLTRLVDRHDFTPREAKHAYPAGTIGQMLGHKVPGARK